MEKIKKAISGFVVLLIVLVLFIIGLWLISYLAQYRQNPPVNIILLLVLCFGTAGFLLKGIMVLQPNNAVALLFFGKYVGTVKDNGLLFVNPFFTRQKITLRMQSLESARLKVNDKMGNPIEIAAVILWQVQDTYRVMFDVTNFTEYLRNQSEAAIRHLASSYAYDIIEDEQESITLRGGGEKVMELLEGELNARVNKAGIFISEARISHLAYAPEIAGAMLQRQQATAIVAARSKIVEGAVGMVEMALELLSRKKRVELDEEKKAAMVSNLMVVLCGEKAATPILNTGTLYQ